MKCKYCGKEFEQNKRGKKKEYCNDKECLKKARNEVQRKWYAKKMDALKGTKNRIIEQEGREKKIVYSSTDRAMNSLANEDFTNVIELARELGAIRFKLTEEIKKCRPDQSTFDKEDQVFLHNIENLAKRDEIYADEIIQAFTTHINKRQNRRVVKDKEEMLKHLLQGIISNPSAYVAQFLKTRDSRTYSPKIKEAK